jgi:hypothetical protein
MIEVRIERAETNLRVLPRRFSLRRWVKAKLAARRIRTTIRQHQPFCDHGP